MEQNNFPAVSIETSDTEKELWYSPLIRVTKFSKYFALVLFIALPFIGFWLGMQQRTIEKPEEPTVISNSSKSLEKLSLTTEQNWITYNNEEYSSDEIGFLINYPQDWYPQKRNDGYLFIQGPEFNGCDSNVPIVCRPTLTIHLRIGDNPKKLPVDIWFEENMSFLSNNHWLETIGGLPAIKSEVAEGIGRPIYHYVSIGEDILSFTYNEASPTSDKQPIDIYESMIKSVQFPDFMTSNDRLGSIPTNSQPTNISAESNGTQASKSFQGNDSNITDRFKVKYPELMPIQLVFYDTQTVALWFENPKGGSCFEIYYINTLERVEGNPYLMCDVFSTVIKSQKYIIEITKKNISYYKFGMKNIAVVPNSYLTLDSETYFSYESGLDFQTVASFDELNNTITANVYESTWSPTNYEGNIELRTVEFQIP
jgi:hypothetical protein